MTTYADYQPLTFHDASRRFADGSDSPRAYLERCLETIARREPVVKALTAMNEAAARAAADASAGRWKAGKPLSSIDGMPVAIKDLLETRDMPTEMGCAAMKGNFPKRDNAAVWALRQAGAVILAKTVTAELGGSHPGPTTNPFDPKRTPGGSSSGSAAAVGANMVPVAIGTQVGGSIIRPAAYCGNVALKPTQGGINRGERLATSQSTHGPHAGCLEDMWQVAIEIAKRCGGDRGTLGLMGPDSLPAAAKPNRLIVLETEGWPDVDAATRAGFAQVLRQLEAAGVTLIRRTDHPFIEALERAIANGRAVCNGITSWENRWYQRGMLDAAPDGLSDRAKATLAKAEAMTPDDYRTHLLARQQAQLAHVAAASLADAAITLACPGPAPIWSGDVPGQPLAPRPTGDFVFNAPSSMLFAPVVTVPLISVGGMPVGVQLMGQQHEDARMTGLARWLVENLKRVTAPA
ncbi:amidase [Reyranella sp. CPCC 100927]|uniref:amidase n=1 Tax=Reyranella sp. CPCC 100927 TaxID=2599616 RepID=UPI0011B74400|nr:amidase [Reyranella sp. CPCC 100927]TWT12582.1 amidase [Reyranella sp. CPCC 100927]